MAACMVIECFHFYESSGCGRDPYLALLEDIESGVVPKFVYDSSGRWFLEMLLQCTSTPECAPDCAARYVQVVCAAGSSSRHAVWEAFVRLCARAEMPPWVSRDQYAWLKAQEVLWTQPQVLQALVSRTFPRKTQALVDLLTVVQEVLSFRAMSAERCAWMAAVLRTSACKLQTP
jgi:hypothetical protein